MSITRDDIRAAVGAGTISEAQAASLVALADARRGARENLDGLDEPFELFKGFNEIFIVVGLSILFAGWVGVTGLSTFAIGPSTMAAAIYAVVGMGGIALLARYFTLKRRMVAPSIALAIMFGLSAIQFGMSAGWLSGMAFQPRVVLASGLSTALLLGYWAVFRVPFTMALVAIGVFTTSAAALVLTGSEINDPRDLFLLSNDGPFAVLTILLGLIGLVFAMRFDMSDPHRVTRRAANGFWLHVIAAPAIVNTVALTLFEIGTLPAQVALFAFISVMALFAIAIDRRSFLVSGVGYVVALAVVVLEGQSALAILFLGLGLVLLGAYWEAIRCAILNALPRFPGKDRLPPWQPST